MLHNLFLGCISVLCRCGLLLQTDLHDCPLYVCLCVTILSRAKTAEPIEMPFGLWTRVGLRNHVLDGGPDPLFKGTILRKEHYLHGKWLDERAAERAKMTFFYDRMRASEKCRTECISVVGDDDEN